MFEALFGYPRSTFERGELVYAAGWPGWLLPALALLGAGVIVLVLVLRRRQASPARLVVIGLLQAALLALVLWVLGLPALETRRLRDGENSVALLLDTSASMAYDTRLEDGRRQLETVLGDAGAGLARLRYEFDDGVRRVDGWTGGVPAGAGSAIADAVMRVLDESKSEPLVAVVVASDGADTAGGITESELAAIAAYGVPVHTLGVGRAAIPEDLELADVRVPDRALPGGTVGARLAIRHDGGGPARVRIHAGDRLLAARDIELAPDAVTTVAWLDVDLADAGPQHLEFTLDGRDDEPELRNNRRSALINVEDRDYRVLYFEGEPRWEYKFLRRAIDGDGGLSVVSLLRVSPNKFYRQGLSSPEELSDGFPATRAALFGYDALIIGSVEAALLSAEQQRLIVDFVAERGGSLLLGGGLHGLGNGGWGQSLVAGALPARLPPIETGSFFRRRATVRLTPHGAASRMLRLAEDDADNAAAWRGLPATADYQLLGDLKPAATALLVGDTDQGEVPLLVTAPYGRGHSYVLATSGTWRWQMSLPAEDLRHETFWRQLLRTMVASAPQPTRLTATDLGGHIGLRAEFLDETFEPLADVAVAAVVSRDDGGSSSVALTPSAGEAGVYTAEFDPGESGIYYVEAVAARDGAAVASARSSLRYDAGRAEHFGIRRNATTLERLARATGGRYLADALAGDLADTLRHSNAGITEIERHPLWNLPAVFALLLVVKGTEWMLRRRWGSI